MLVREKALSDASACLELLERVHQTDGYPLHLPPEDVPGFLAAGHEVGAWVAEEDGRIVGHVALHAPPGAPTIAAAAAATGLAEERLLMLCRLFVAPDHRRAGLARTLLRHATRRAEAVGRRVVLDVGQSLGAAVALYEAEGWSRVDELHLALDDGPVLDLWVYVSPGPTAEIWAIGRVESPLTDVADAPRQGDEGAPDACLVIDASYADAVRDLAVGDHLVLLTWLHRARRDVQVTQPRGDPFAPLTGVFATRSPDRPNPIGIHEVRVLAVDGLRVGVSGLEAVDGTPVVDIKPRLGPVEER